MDQNTPLGLFVVMIEQYNTAQKSFHGMAHLKQICFLELMSVNGTSVSFPCQSQQQQKHS